MANFIILQFNPQARTPTKNIAYICSRITTYTDALVIMPEFFLSSYSDYDFIDSHKLQALLEPLITLGAKNRLAFTGSLPIKTKYGRFNRGIYIHDGRIEVKDKQKLFGKEKQIMKRGHKNPIFQYKNILFTLQICLDIVDPTQTHVATLKGAGLVINPATVSVDFLRTINKARALENNIIAAFCNRSGKDQDGTQYLGRSGVFFANGTEKIAPKTSSIITFTA